MGSEDDVAAIRAVVQEWLAASEAQDGERLRPLMAEDVVFLLPGRPPMEGREAFMAAFRETAGRHRLECTWHPEEIRVHGDLGWCRSRLEVRLKMDGAPLQEMAGPTLTLFGRQHGRWVLLRDANMLAPVPGKPPAA